MEKKILKSTPAQLRAARNYKRKNSEQHKASCKEWRKNNPEKVKAQHSKSRDSKFGEGAQAHFDKQVEEQQSNCAMCSEPLVKSPRLDHNHETGQWRGVVCPRCNIALGYYENETLFQKALAYLKFWSK